MQKWMRVREGSIRRGFRGMKKLVISKWRGVGLDSDRRRKKKKPPQHPQWSVVKNSCQRKQLIKKKLSTLQRIIQGNVRQNRTFSLCPSTGGLGLLFSQWLFFSVCARFNLPQGTIPSGHFSCNYFYDQLKLPNRKCSFLHSHIWKNSVC